MTLDPPTILLTSTIVFVVLAGAQVLIWAQNRREGAVLWMAAAGLLCNGSALLREVLPPIWVIGLANVILLMGTCCMATACRSLRARAPAWIGFLLPTLAWLVACLFPAFTADQSLRIAVSSCLVAALMVWAVMELWLDRAERLMARTLLIGLFTIQGSAAALRAIMAGTTIGPMQQAAVVRTSDIPLVTLWAYAFLFIASVGVILFTKERSERRLAQVADQDALTGLANRRCFEQALETAIGTARRQSHALAVLMVDADAFKLYNDRYGHLAGDHVLKEIAGVLQAAALRSRGLAARHGGEEFIILFPATAEASALAIAETICRDVEALGVMHEDSPFGRVTVSIGATARAPGNDTQARDYLHAADQGLYAAKRSGRNRSRSWPALGPDDRADRMQQTPLPSLR